MTMLENGLDFLLDAVKHLECVEQIDDEDEKSNHVKYCILHMAAGIELVLKSRLFREHWTYIFADMNKASRKDFETGSFKSVDGADSIKRLKSLCEIPISVDSEKAFSELKKIRNQMEHFAKEEPYYAVETSINAALSAIVQFVSTFYSDFTSPLYIDFKHDDGEDGLTAKENELIKQLTQRMADLKAQHSSALELARARANDEAVLDDLVVCPACKEKMLRIDDGESCRCFFCGFTADGPSAAVQYVENVLNISEYELVKDGEEFPVFDCPECGKNAMTIVNDEYVCFSCAERYPADKVGRCNECGALYLKKENDIGLCNSCIEYKMSE